MHVTSNLEPIIASNMPHSYGIIFEVTESVKRHVEGQKTSRGNSSPNKNKVVGLPTTKSCHRDFRCGSLVFRSKDTLYFRDKT